MPPVVDRGHSLTIHHIGGTACADKPCDLLMARFVFVELPLLLIPFDLNGSRLRDVLTKISNGKD